MSKLNLRSLFCHRTHYALRKPWSIEEHTYYSDDHIIVRVPRRSRVPENPLAPDARRLPWADHGPPAFIPGWDLQDPELRDEIKNAPAGHDLFAAFSEDGVQLQVKLVLKLQRLPGVMLEDRPKGYVGPVYFSWDGGDGFIMPGREAAQ